MMKSIAAFAVVLAFFTTPATALDCPTPYLCFLNGSWAADGTSFGKPSRVTMRWEAVLGGKFARIEYRIVTKGEGGMEQVFEGVASIARSKTAPTTAPGSTAKAPCIL